MKREAPARKLFTHFTPVDSVWGDMDALGHVNNVLYFRYAETARIDYMDRLISMVPGMSSRMWKDEGIILAEISCRYLQQLHAPVSLKLGTRIARIGAKTLLFESAMFKGDETDAVAVAEATVVWFNYQAQKACAVPDAVRTAVLELENTAPALPDS